MSNLNVALHHISIFVSAINFAVTKICYKISIYEASTLKTAIEIACCWHIFMVFRHMWQIATGLGNADLNRVYKEQKHQSMST